jgi:hypothetical protein
MRGFHRHLGHVSSGRMSAVAGEGEAEEKRQDAPRVRESYRPRLRNIMSEITSYQSHYSHLSSSLCEKAYSYILERNRRNSPPTVQQVFDELMSSASDSYSLRFTANIVTGSNIVQPAEGQIFFEGEMDDDSESIINYNYPLREGMKLTYMGSSDNVGESHVYDVDIRAGSAKIDPFDESASGQRVFAAAAAGQTVTGDLVPANTTIRSVNLHDRTFELSRAIGKTFRAVILITGSFVVHDGDMPPVGTRFRGVVNNEDRYFEVLRVITPTMFAVTERPSVNKTTSDIDFTCITAQTQAEFTIHLSVDSIRYILGTCTWNKRYRSSESMREYHADVLLNMLNEPGATSDALVRDTLHMYTGPDRFLRAVEDFLLTGYPKYFTRHILEKELNQRADYACDDQQKQQALSALKRCRELALQPDMPEYSQRSMKRERDTIISAAKSRFTAYVSGDGLITVTIGQRPKVGDQIRKIGQSGYSRVSRLIDDTSFRIRDDVGAFGIGQSSDFEYGVPYSLFEDFCKAFWHFYRHHTDSDVNDAVRFALAMTHTD